MTLFISPAIVKEIRDVLTRPEMRERFPALTPDRVSRFTQSIFAKAQLVRDVPPVFSLPRDPKDEPYINLAIAVRPCHLVTWNDRHLTYLMRRDTPEGIDFFARFPTVIIADPPAFARQFTGNKGVPPTSWLSVERAFMPLEHAADCLQATLRPQF